MYFVYLCVVILKMHYMPTNFIDICYMDNQNNVSINNTTLTILSNKEYPGQSPERVHINTNVDNNISTLALMSPDINNSFDFTAFKEIYSRYYPNNPLPSDAFLE